MYFVGFDTDKTGTWEKFADEDAAMERVEELAAQHGAHHDASIAELVEYEFGDRYGMVPEWLEADPEEGPVGWPVMVTAVNRADLDARWEGFLCGTR